MAITKNDDQKNRQALTDLMVSRILITDGAMGTALDLYSPTAEMFGGESLMGCNEMLNVHAPEIVQEIHRGYIEAGADIIETNSFNGSQLVLTEYNTPFSSRELARLAARNARRAVKQASADRPVFVMGSMGPGSKSITVTGGIDFDGIRAVYREYAAGLLEGGADILVLETSQDVLNLKAAIMGIADAQTLLDRNAPLGVSVTIERNGAMLAGHDVLAMHTTLAHFDLFFLGLNCALGPDMIADHLRGLAEISRFPVSIWPNAGMPEADGSYTQTAEMFASTMGRFAKQGLVNIVGGCCGTTAKHIAALKKTLAGCSPRECSIDAPTAALAGKEAVVFADMNRPIHIGERTNTIGSRKFKRLVSEERWDEAAEIGREQVRRGAMIVDLCTANPDRDETADFINVLTPLQRRTKAPLFIDSIDPKTIEAALKQIAGKAAINSVNLEDGGQRMREMAVLAREYGAALVCGLIDERGMAVSLERKLDVARRIVKLLMSEYRFNECDIILDTLVFPAATGDPNYIGAAKHTIEAIRQLKTEFPNCPTILGVSNVSFGLPVAGREIMNSVFLYNAVQAGLDLAIVNTERLHRYPLISERDRKLAESVLFESSPESITEFTTRHREPQPRQTEDERRKLPLDERIALAVVEARRDGLRDDLTEKLKTASPLEIINGALMNGMDDVGRQFNDNRLIVTEVLESAEVMKLAVDFLREHLPAGESVGSKGKLLLATVKGDVHDIGKNLVDMIFSNNGFEVVNLGIKVDPATLIDAFREHKPDIIGLSGLLVRSAVQMVATATDLSAAGIATPMLVGGAALTKNFVRTQIAPAYAGDVYYASDAMMGLTIAKDISAGNGSVSTPETPAPTESKPKKALPSEESTPRWIKTDVPTPPDLQAHTLHDIPIEEVVTLINPQMLLGKHLGIKGLRAREKDESDTLIMTSLQQMNDVISDGFAAGVLRPKAVYQWFRAEADGELIRVRDARTHEEAVFHFPRQTGGKKISATDWIRPTNLGGDYIGLFVTTSGSDSARLAETWRDAGRLRDAHILQAVAIELAEATAEWVHLLMRREWGFPDPPGVDKQWLFKTQYRGIRLSFGYPACPLIEDQEPLFDLMKPERIGVTLTEGMMMHPESSVSAVVFHHPDGTYYAV